MFVEAEEASTMVLDQLRLSDVMTELQVNTPMTDGREGTSSKMLPEQVAEKIISVIQGRKNEILVGKTKLLHWISRISPSIARKILKKSD